MSLLLTGGLLIGLTACGSTDTTTVSSTAPETTVSAAADPISTSAGPATTPAATSTTSTVGSAGSTVAANGAKPSTTAATTASTAVAAATASKPDLSAVLALLDSAEKSAADVDKELNTANNAMNSTEQDPQS